MSDTSSKMFEIARHFKELNKYGKVKGFKGNEKGYAKIIGICRGCSIWVHHEKNDNLIINLLVSPSARENNATLCSNTIKKFQKFFDFSINQSIWNHSIDTYKDHERLYVVVSEKNTSEIIDIVERLKKEFV